MASWSFGSQLFLVALFSWSVHALPAQIGWRQSDSEDTRVNPGPRNAKAKSSFPMSKVANSSVVWVIARPKGLDVWPSKQFRPAVSQVANPPKLRPALAQNPEGPAVLWPVETQRELPAPESPVVSWAVDSLKEPSPPQSSGGPVESLLPENPDVHAGLPTVDFLESLLPENPDVHAGLPMVDFLEALPLENPDVPAGLPVADFLESLLPPESTDSPASLPTVDALENLLPPPSIPNGPASSWLVDPAMKLPFPSSPEMPSVPWKVGRPKKFPPPPPAPEASADKWLAQVTKKVPSPPKKQDSGPWVNAPKREPLGHPPKRGAADVTWVVQPPKRTLLHPSPQSPGASWGIHSEALNPLKSDPRLPPAEPEQPYPSIGSLEQGISKGEVEPLPFAYPAFPYRGGELSKSAALYEHGSSAHETEDYGFFPKYPYGGLPMGARLPAPLPYLKRVPPNLFYLFMTGQLPHGTVSHMQTDYEAGGDRASQVGYERFLPPQGPGIPHKTKVSIKQL
ncbi:vegetative cell wall protein gp1 [Fundulus heteroclitus]|uniref:vegetative cell wall protein gp1 n=1 Tax=Fundulus heteroclitus TaxID=8078 RepID=UPI00165A6814|nr:vegetative cell wall protein gp1 [Fundulus heteroclitus]